MKAAQNICRLVVGCVFAYCLSLFTQLSFAIEGIQITVPSTNAILSWPSDSSETYIIQYRHTLSSTDSWSTLADSYPADGTTNINSFVDTNIIEYGYAPAGAPIPAAAA